MSSSLFSSLRATIASGPSKLPANLTTSLRPQFSSFSPITSSLRSSGPHRLNSTQSNNQHRSTPPPASSAPQQSRSNFPIIPILAIVALGSGSYILLVKSRTGQNQSRPSN